MCRCVLNLTLTSTRWQLSMKLSRSSWTCDGWYYLLPPFPTERGYQTPGGPDVMSEHEAPWGTMCWFQQIPNEGMPSLHNGRAFYACQVMSRHLGIWESLSLLMSCLWLSRHGFNPVAHIKIIRVTYMARVSTMCTVSHVMFTVDASNTLGILHITTPSPMYEWTQYQSLYE